VFARSPSPIISPTLSHLERRTSILASIDEVPEASADGSDNESTGMSGAAWRLPQEMGSNLTAPDMFSIFIAHLGPPMVGRYHASSFMTDGYRNLSPTRYVKFSTSSLMGQGPSML
jgi:hypothetical protein